MSWHVLMLAWNAAASATPLPHEGLQRAVPAQNARISAVPNALRLTFSSAPQLRFTRVRLFGPGGDSISLAPLRIDSVRTVVAEIRGRLVAGTQTVRWQVAGADGHPVRGSYTFTIDSAATGLNQQGANNADSAAHPAMAPSHHDPSMMPTNEPGFDSESPAYVAIRWISLTALVALLGVAAFRVVVLRVLRWRGTPADADVIASATLLRTSSIGATAAVILLLSAIARLVAQVYALSGGAGTLDTTAAGPLLRETLWGKGWMLQAGASIIAIVAFLAMRRAVRWAFPIAALAVLSLAFTPAFSGHAASVPRLTALTMLSDGIHVLGAGGWLGCLLAILLVGIPAALADEANARRRVADLINAFSPTALLFAGLTAGTGLFAVWMHLGSVPALWETRYGRVLLTKLGVLSVVAATGAYNWLRVRPALGGPEGTKRIRRSSTVEVTVGAVVLLVTAVLVATPTPTDMSGMGGLDH